MRDLISTSTCSEGKYISPPLNNHLNIHTGALACGCGITSVIKSIIDLVRRHSLQGHPEIKINNFNSRPRFDLVSLLAAVSVETTTGMPTLAHAYLPRLGFMNVIQRLNHSPVKVIIACCAISLVSGIPARVENFGIKLCSGISEKIRHVAKTMGLLCCLYP